VEHQFSSHCREEPYIHNVYQVKLHNKVMLRKRKLYLYLFAAIMRSETL